MCCSHIKYKRSDGGLKLSREALTINPKIIRKLYYLYLNMVLSIADPHNIGIRIIYICKNNNLLMINDRFGANMNSGSSAYQNNSVIQYINSYSMSEYENDKTTFKLGCSKCNSLSIMEGVKTKITNRGYN